MTNIPNITLIPNSFTVDQTEIKFDKVAQINLKEKYSGWMALLIYQEHPTYRNNTITNYPDPQHNTPFVVENSNEFCYLDNVGFHPWGLKAHVALVRLSDEDKIFLRFVVLSSNPESKKIFINYPNFLR